MDAFLQDLKYAARMLARNPAFTTVAVLTLALGIGANSTIFTWVKAVILQPLPGVARSSELVSINGRKGEHHGLSNHYPEYVYFREHNNVFSGATAHELISLSLSSLGTNDEPGGDGGSKPELVTAGIVSGNFFDVLEVKPALGRTFLPEEDATPETHPVVVIGDRLWRQRFAADPRVIGSQVMLNRHRFTIIGVTPQGFAGNYGGLAEELWVPLMMQGQILPGGDLLQGKFGIQIMARLKPGVSIASASAEMHLLARQFAQAHPEFYRGWDVFVDPLSQSQRGIESSIAQVVVLLMAVAGLVLLIACGNVANLLLARAFSRRKEVAIRLAMGASRGRLAQQLLTESALLAALGGLAALVATEWTGGALLGLLPSFGMPMGMDLRVDYRVTGFTLLISLVTGVLFGFAPVFQSSKVDLVETLKGESGSIAGGYRKSRIRTVLVVAQLSLSVVVLVGTGLLGRALLHAVNTDTGFKSAHVQMAQFDLFLNGYDEARGREFDRQVIEKIKTVPGVTDASLTSYVPMGLYGGGNSRRVTIDGYTPGPAESPDLDIVTDYVGPGYLRTMGIALEAGREFSFDDNELAPAKVIINEAMARRYWPGKDPTGRSLVTGKKSREIVGVARDIVYRVVGESPEPQMYLPVLQEFQPEMTIVARTTGAPGAVWPQIERAVHTLDPTLPFSQVGPLDAHIATSFWTQKSAAALLAAFGAVALALAGTGLYGLMAFWVSQRTREMGIRAALGAGSGEVIGLVMGQVLKLTAWGIGIGLAGAFAVTRLLSSLLLGVSATDPLTFVAVPVVLALVAMGAAFIPVRRAMLVDPAIALRHE